MPATDLKELFFEHKILDRISGEPDFPQLHSLLRACKANACSVPSTLGGGQNGYIGMLVSAVAYASLAPGTPFTAPVHPGALPPLPNGTQYQITQLKSQHDESKRVYEEYILMQWALIAQVISVLEAKYLSALRNRVTGQLPSDIRAIFLYLFKVYGKIKPEFLLLKKNEVETKRYDISDPIDTIFNEIEDLAELGELSNKPFSETQLVDFGFIIFNKCRAFRSDIREWIRRPLHEHTYTNFKLHFTEAHLELRATDATVDELGYHSANAIVQQIVEQMQANTDDSPTPPPSPPPVIQPPPVAEIPQANAVVTQTALLSQMMERLAKMEDRDIERDNPPYRGRGRGNRDRYRGRGRGRFGRNGQGGGYRPRRGGKYCHTHGNCAHTSQECETRAEGHIETATFSNMQGGSTNNCE